MSVQEHIRSTEKSATIIDDKFHEENQLELRTNTESDKEITAELCSQSTHDSDQKINGFQPKNGDSIEPLLGKNRHHLCVEPNMKQERCVVSLLLIKFQ